MENREEDLVKIGPSSGWFEFNFEEMWRYRDLLWLFIRRDVVTVYKQTILGPLWYIFQPILTTLMFTLVFGKIARISTDGAPPIVFYLSGLTIWNYFSDCLHRTSNTFVNNQHIFGKVYFPRIIVPGSIVVSTMIRFIIQFGLFLLVWIYYYLNEQVAGNLVTFLLPLVVLIMAITSLGFGMIFSSLTTKYRDLQFLLSFSIQLWMYATPIIYPISIIPEKYATLIGLNPITPLVETVRHGFLGQGNFSFLNLGYSALFAFVVFFIGLFVFSKVEKSFMDTV